MTYVYEGREYEAAALPAALAADGLPVTPGELDNAEAVPSMLDELQDLGHIIQRDSNVYRRST